MKLLSRIQDISNLAPLPSIVARIIEVVNNPRSSARDVSGIIKNDQALTARILKISNSAFYGFNRRVGNVDHAIVILGFDEVLNITLALCLARSFPGDGESHLDRHAFWLHSIGTAYIAKSLSRMLNRDLNPEDAFVAGLLHDFGKIILDRHFPGELQEAIELAEAERIQLFQAERSLFETDHGEIGSMVADNWLLPVPLVNSIRFHHQPEQAEEGEYFVNLTNLSDYFAHRFEIGASGNPVLPEILPETLETLKIRVEEQEDIWNSINLDMEMIESYL